jgi:hypothetical protein
MISGGPDGAGGIFSISWGGLVGTPHVRKCHQMSSKEHIQLGWVVRWVLSTPPGHPAARRWVRDVAVLPLPLRPRPARARPSIGGQSPTPAPRKLPWRPPRGPNALSVFIPGCQSWLSKAAASKPRCSLETILLPRSLHTRDRDRAAFDSRWVPQVGDAPVNAPSRHTGTGGATDGAHAQCLRDSDAGDRSPVVPRAAARRSQVVPRSKQLGSPTRRCRAEQAAGQVARRGDAEAAEEMRGPASGRAQEGRRQPPERGQRTSKFVAASCGYFLGILIETQEDRETLTRDRDRGRIGRLFNDKRIRSAAEPQARLFVLSLTHKWEATWSVAGNTRRSSSRSSVLQRVIP